MLYRHKKKTTLLDKFRTIATTIKYIKTMQPVARPFQQ